ncbi:MAG TPA: leucine zipper domain-containing protein, partial [Roseiarcus sp.]
MDMHENASLTPKDREAMAGSGIEGGLAKAAAARAFHTTPRMVAKWVERFRIEGVAGLRDRSSRPQFIAKSRLMARPSAARRLRGGRGFAKAAPHRRADWRRGRTKRSSCLRFLFNALRFFRGFGVR